MPGIGTAAARVLTRPPFPWVIDDIDYGPAIAAVHDLAAWAFDVVAESVVDWPEGERRVRSARHFVLDHLRGKRSRRVPAEDVVFCAALLARILEADFDLGMSEVVTVLDQLGLPTDEVPLRPRAQSCRLAPITPLHARAAATVDPEPIDCCGTCDRLPLRYRNAA